jgi:hypothetical protein
MNYDKEVKTNREKEMEVGRKTMQKDYQDKEVSYLLKATGNGGPTSQSELSAKQ